MNNVKLLVSCCLVAPVVFLVMVSTALTLINDNTTTGEKLELHVCLFRKPRLIDILKSRYTSN